MNSRPTEFKHTFFKKISPIPENELEKLKNLQLTPLSYFGQRESIIPDIFALLGTNKYQCFYDPFAGSCSISFAAMDCGIANDYSINDSFPILAKMWEYIKRLPNEFICDYSKYVDAYCKQPKENREAFYKDMVKNFNDSNKAGFYLKSSVLFAFLINFADSNMPFFDKDLNLTTKPNVFINVEHEKTKLGMFEKRVLHLSKLLNQYKTTFSGEDFFSCIETASKGDFVIFDPPYPEQAENVYFKLKKEKTLEDNMKTAFSQLNKKGVDFIVLYGARIVKLSNHFDDAELGMQHLVRLSTHRTLGRFLDHIYVSPSIPLTPEQLPPGTAFYNTLFRPGEEMSSEKYDESIFILQAQLATTNESHKKESEKNSVKELSHNEEGSKKFLKSRL